MNVFDLTIQLWNLGLKIMRYINISEFMVIMLIEEWLGQIRQKTLGSSDQIDFAMRRSETWKKTQMGPIDFVHVNPGFLFSLFDSFGLMQLRGVWKTGVEKNTHCIHYMLLPFLNIFTPITIHMWLIFGTYLSIYLSKSNLI